MTSTILVLIVCVPLVVFFMAMLRMMDRDHR